MLYYLLKMHWDHLMSIGPLHRVITLTFTSALNIDHKLLPVSDFNAHGITPKHFSQVIQYIREPQKQSCDFTELPWIFRVL